MENFSGWLNEKFLEWEKSKGSRQNYSAYARYLGVKQPTLTRWLNDDNPPEGENLSKLADKYGVEVFDVLGIELSEEEREMWEFRLILKALTPEERAELKRQGYRMLNKSGPPGHTGQPQKTREGAAPPEVFNKKQ